MREHTPGKIVLAVVAAMSAACASSTTTSTDTTAANDCEPGRCLEDISRVILEHRAEARACFDDGAKNRPDLRGFVVINFEIDPAGAVMSARQSMKDDQIAEPAIVDCIAGVIQRITFATSPRGKTTRGYHRFDFAPR